jgi:hypothetical protein
MNALAKSDKTTPSVAMKLLVDQHGAWAVLRALVGALVPTRAEVIRLDDLDAHMRRDMGLPPIEGPRRYWELR